jgi:hypothetical protein
MSRLEVPIRYRTLWVTGDLLLRAHLDLLLKNNAGHWCQETFLVDSGTEMTTFPASLAQSLNLPMPQQATRGLVHSQTGLPIRSGYLRVRVVGMAGTEYVFPCFFLGDPNVPVPKPGPTTPRNLLGLSGVINQLRLQFDGTIGPGAPYGTLTVERSDRPGVWVGVGKGRCGRGCGPNAFLVSRWRPDGVW